MIDNEIVLQLQEHFEQQEGGVFRRLWWAHDGAPPHRRIIIRNRLIHLFNMRVIALNHEIKWPPRSPDLTPCDFFLWGHLKDNIYTSPRARIVAAVETLRGQRDVIRNAVRSMRTRAEV